MSNVRFPTATSAIRIVGALALLAAGGVHLQQYVSAHYSAIPTIGTLFMLNFIGAVVVGVGLLIPIERTRLGVSGVVLLSIAGVAMSATAIAFLLISEHTPLFGFMESGYRTPVLVALISEGLGAHLLALLSASRHRAVNS
jgi:hypothetical protein